MRVPQDYGQLSSELAAMARDLLAQQSVADTLNSIVEHATRLVDGCDAAGILAVRHGAVHSLAGTDPIAQVTDQLQAQFDGGPCMDAVLRGEQIYRIEDTHTADGRWPKFAEEAARLGVGSMMGFLLYTHGENNLGALDLYAKEPGAFHEGSEHVGWVLAAHAAVALSAARHVESMDRALASSRAIGEAVGIVMSRYQLTEDAAFEAIRRSSQTHNRKVRDLAHIIITTGMLPTEPSS